MAHTTLEVEINLNEWNKPPPLYQKAIEAAAAESNLKMLAEYESVNGEALKRLVDGGTKLMPYSQEILDAARKAAFELYEAKAAEDRNLKAVYEQWLAFRKQVQGWNFTNEFVMLKPCARRSKKRNSSKKDRPNGRSFF